MKLIMNNDICLLAYIHSYEFVNCITYRAVKLLGTSVLTHMQQSICVRVNDRYGH